MSLQLDERAANPIFLWVAFWISADPILRLGWRIENRIRNIEIRPNVHDCGGSPDSFPFDGFSVSD